MARAAGGMAAAAAMAQRGSLPGCHYLAASCTMAPQRLWHRHDILAQTTGKFIDRAFATPATTARYMIIACQLTRQPSCYRIRRILANERHR